jgi:hypothetical protein
LEIEKDGAAFVAGGKMSDEELKAELERLRAENESLKKSHARGVSLK